MKLEGQSAIVTGGASGMGLACVEGLQKKGVTVIVWDKNVANTDTTLQVDVSSAEEVEAAISKTCERIGNPRICINCAGIAPAKRMVGKDGPMPLDMFKKVIDVNLIGTFNVMRVAASVMTKLTPLEDDERGVIINTASVAAFEGQIGQMAYSASKGGVVALTLPAARELAQFGVRVNTIAPGLVATPLLLNMPAQVQESLAASVPFPKRLGKPSEFAALAEELITNVMMNGAVVRIDGAIRMEPK